jgi:hypothetical protein
MDELVQLQPVEGAELFAASLASLEIKKRNGVILRNKPTQMYFCRNEDTAVLALFFGY